ncbi:alkaline phosphatase family protein [Thermoactinomyces sp. DSM 45892]|uniref:alkaline phosphatase family protein n=1 Tax=Thermoactinomyces sp. DSM 45892 TaxID=1882753 RepID=UPI0008987BC9|nr:alkaline phosphatase family protein [Thermoactinomyces sp. DSM 45892]SDY99827.1 Predicted phosphohydrolase or phosphomutase, AlkP superfamily [Thermoactinomyces sp. DSM 45892]
MARPKVALIGLDCAEPSLVFDRWIDDLPNIKRIMESGVYAPLRSCDPPITVPAWACMMTGKDPGQLGFYGFRNRAGYDYLDVGLVDSSQLNEPTVWDQLGKYGYKSIIMGVPPSYPPKPMKGCLISCFLTPDQSATHTYPPELQEEIKEKIGDYQFDVKHFRTHLVEELTNDIYQMTETRFKTAKYLLEHKEWDFFAMVEMGIDRMHHAFWHYMDETHVLHKPSPYQKVIFRYYQYVDQQIGELLEQIPEGTHVFIVSDHGAKKMDGGFCLNEWLINEGYLTLKGPATEPTPLTPDLVNWNKTKAWGYGGYYGRLCLNIKGREPDGIVPFKHAEKLRNEIIQKIKSVRNEQGTLMNNKVFKPQKRYTTVKNIPPDLLIYFGDLYWRSVGTVGNGTLFVKENDTGPDGANHDYNGIFIQGIKNKDTRKFQRVDRLHITDVAPTILNIFQIPMMKGILGKAKVW